MLTDYQKRVLEEAARRREERENGDPKGSARTVAELAPFDRVLVRDDKEQVWKPDILAFKRLKATFPYVTISGTRYKRCIPYEGNEHLCLTKGEEG